MSRELRDYQELAIRQIYNAWAENKKPLLCMPTGAGKSFTIFWLIRQISKVYHVVLAVRKRGLVEQLEKDAKSFNMWYGVAMAGHPEFVPHRKLQICSIDTLRARQLYPHEDKEKVAVIIDEADESLSKSYIDFIGAYPKAKLLGMTATPYNGLYHFDKLVMPVTAKDLRDSGVLVDYKYYVPSSAIDTSDIDIRDGQFNQKQVDQKASAIVGDAVKSWLDFAEYRPTLVFAANVEHSMGLAYMFNQHGIPAAHSDANTPKDERKKLIQEFREGRIKVLCNVGLYLRGTDIPEIGCIIDAAPTLAMNRHVQKMGRGSRKNDFFKDCIYIDMAQNVINLGHFYMDRSGLIDLKKPLKLNRTELNSKELMRACLNCFGCFEPSQFIDGKCPRCGHASKAKKIAKTKKGELEEIDPEVLEEQMIIKKFRKMYWQYRNLDHFKSKYLGDTRRIRAAILKKLSDEFGMKVYRIINKGRK